MFRPTCQLIQPLYDLAWWFVHQLFVCIDDGWVELELIAGIAFFDEISGCNDSSDGEPEPGVEIISIN
jgi:hypothetical protein